MYNFCCFDYFSYIDEPPTLYSLMKSIAPSGTHTSDLWKFGRNYFFDFEYDLQGINKEFFEKMILNHYLTRRINYQTAELFKLKLESKLLEALPKYNLLFNNIYFNVFDNGTTERQFTFSEHYVDNSAEKNFTNENLNTSVKGAQQTLANTENNDIRNETNNNNTTNTRKFSDTPQNLITDIEDGSYLTEYEKVINENTNTTNVNSNSKTAQNATLNNSNLTLSNNSRNYSNNKDSYYNKTNTNTENVVNTSNKLDSVIKIQQEYLSVFTMLYKDLDCLFYGLV